MSVPLYRTLSYHKKDRHGSPSDCFWNSDGDELFKEGGGTSRPGIEAAGDHHVDARTRRVAADGKHEACGSQHHGARAQHLDCLPALRFFAQLQIIGFHEYTHTGSAWVDNFNQYAHPAPVAGVCRSIGIDSLLLCASLLVVIAL